MKVKNKSLLSLIVIFIFAFPSNAQWSIGLNGGINFGDMKKSNQISEAESSFRNGLVVGGVLTYELSSFFDLLLEIRYIQKGINVKVNMPSHISEGEGYFEYLEFPLYLRAKFNNEILKPFILGGINFGYLLNAIEEGTLNGKTFKYDITEAYEKLDVAIDVGIGLEYLFSSNTSYLFNLRYSYGLSDVLKYQDATHYHRGIQLLFGMFYKL